jgi:hypothetical protein
MANAIPFPCDPGFIESFAQELEALPPKASAARHNVIRQLLPQIEGMLQKGYTLAEGHARFLLKGIVCSFETFRRHVRKAQAQRDEQRKYQGAGTVVENSTSNFGNQAVQVESSTSSLPVHPIQSAVHSVVSASAQGATEVRSGTQPIAEPIVMASVNDSPADREAQAIAQQWVEPEPSTPASAQAVAAHSSAIAPAMADERLVPELSEPEIRDRFSAFSTPRLSEEEIRKHFQRY